MSNVAHCGLLCWRWGCTNAEMPPCFPHRGSNSMGLPPAPLTALIAPEPVRHSRIPDLPLENPLVFELLLFLYLLVALFVQYINIYRTVWWYPYSNHAASTSLVPPGRPLSSSRPLDVSSC